jgi:hypothetical protein
MITATMQLFLVANNMGNLMFLDLSDLDVRQDARNLPGSRRGSTSRINSSSAHDEMRPNSDASSNGNHHFFSRKLTTSL